MSPAAPTLPLRVTPVPGESLESWLHALAHRHRAPWGDLLDALLPVPQPGPGRTWRRRFTYRLTLSVTDDEAAAIAHATGTAVADIHAMTLARYAGRATGLDPVAGTYTPFPWGRTHGSRYCPQCLADTAGRWQLAWRLGWTFLCPQHRCLLLDRCPQCRQRQRLQPLPTPLIPQPGTCLGSALLNDTRTKQFCTAQLADQPIVVLPREHPAVHAQHVIHRIIARDLADVGVYRTHPQTARAALADIRSLARRVLIEPESPALPALVPADIVAAHRTVKPTAPVSGYHAGAHVPADAATTAAGVIGALAVLGCDTVDAAGDRFAILLSATRARGTYLVAANLSAGPKTPVLKAVQLAALAPELSVIQQLNYRIGTVEPPTPTPSPARSRSAMARRLPTMLWAQWSLRLTPPQHPQRVARQTLSAAVLIAGSTHRLGDALATLRSTQSSQSAYHFVNNLFRQPYWPTIRAAIIALHDDLIDHEPPIDYTRRRQLNYRTLLTQTQWQNACDTAGISRFAVHLDTARLYLYQRISGMPAATSGQPWPAIHNTMLIGPMCRQLTPTLAAALDTCAADFLASQHVTDEPVTWTPDTTLIADLALPGAADLDTDTAALHHLVRHGYLSVTAAAQQLGRPVDYVRDLLMTSPAPTTVAYNRRYRPTAQETITCAELYRRYEIERQSTRAIGEDLGYEKVAIAKRLRQCGIQIHDKHGQ
ncbi:TniQ family protein [Mycobacterium sp. NPDC003323]